MRRRRDFWLAHGALIGLSARVFCRRITSKNERAGSAQPPRSPPAGPGVSACLSGDRGPQTVLVQRIACFGSPTVSVFFRGVRGTCNGAPPRAPNPAALQQLQRRFLSVPRARLRGGRNAALLRPQPIAASTRDQTQRVWGVAGRARGVPAPRRVRECVVCSVYRRRVCAGTAVACVRLTAGDRVDVIVNTRRGR